MGKGVYGTSVHLLVPLKQLLENGSQTTAHGSYVKHILEMLDLFELLVWS